jgi:hypothetical protein
MAFYGFLWFFMAFTQKYGFLWNSHQTDDFGAPGISEKLSFRKKILFVAGKRRRGGEGGKRGERRGGG